MCEKAFRKYRLNYNELLKSEEMEKASESFGFKTAEDLIVNVGYGKITPLQVVRKFIPKSDETEKKKPDSFFDKIINRVRKRKAATGVLVRGIDDILIRFGKCCQPVPGDPITGYCLRRWFEKIFYD